MSGSGSIEARGGVESQWSTKRESGSSETRVSGERDESQRRARRGKVRIGRGKAESETKGCSERSKVQSCGQGERYRRPRPEASVNEAGCSGERDERQRLEQGERRGGAGGGRKK